MVVPEYEWWPDGATEQRVRECNCDWCAALVAELDDTRAAESGDAPATDDGDLSLEAFVG